MLANKALQYFNLTRESIPDSKELTAKVNQRIGNQQTTVTTLRSLENKDVKQSTYLTHGDKEGVKALATLRFRTITAFSKSQHNQEISPFCSFEECRDYLHLQTIEHLMIECQHLKDPREFYSQQLERYKSNPGLNILLGDLSEIQEQDRVEALDIIIKFAKVVVNEVKRCEVSQDT